MPPQPTKPSVPPPPSAPRPPRRLLIVEDHALLGKLFREIAGDLCEAWLASSAHQALALLEAMPFDVVLVDANLGSGPNGIWLLHQVALGWPDVRRCLMSGAQYFPHRDEYVFFMKPLSFEDLREVVGRPPSELGLLVRRAV